MFATAKDEDTEYEPIVPAESVDGTSQTVPHGLDRDIVPALPALWYCLHLPATLFELTSIPARVLKLGQNLDLGHSIILSPVGLFDPEHIGPWSDLYAPALAFCPDELVDEATIRAAALGFPYPPLAFSQLSNDSLRAHWQAVHSLLAPGAPYLGRAPRLAARLDLQAVDLPRRLLSRQFGSARDEAEPETSDLLDLTDQALWQQIVLAAARLETEATSRDAAKKRMSDALREAA